MNREAVSSELAFGYAFFVLLEADKQQVMFL
jgi:hypothetical protein